jgi:hypothetical protein
MDIIHDMTTATNESKQGKKDQQRGDRPRVELNIVF